MRYFALAALLVGCNQKAILGDPPAAAVPPGTTFEVIEAPKQGGTQDTGYWPNLLVNHGVLTVAYCDANLGDAKVARRGADGTWSIETVESKGAVGKYMAATLGPGGIELVYFDQSRKTLRHAAEGVVDKKPGWVFSDIATDKEDLGISGRFLITTKGERLFVHYNTRNELLLSQADGSAAPTWTTQKLATAGGVYNIQVDLGFDKAGRLLVVYPNWAVSRSTLYQGVIANLKAAKLEEELQFRKVDEEGIAGLKSGLVFIPEAPEIVYMASRGGVLYSAKLEKNEFVKQRLLGNVANFSATGMSDGRLAVALQVGRSEGLGEGALHLGVREKSGAFKEYALDEARPVGQYLSIAEAPGKTRPEIAIAYYDGVKKALRLARIP